MKNILKTILAVMLAAMMIMSFAACDAGGGGSSDDNRLTRAEKDEDEEETTKSEEKSEENNEAQTTEAPRQTEAAAQVMATTPAAIAEPAAANVLPLVIKSSETIYAADQYMYKKYYSLFLTEDNKLMYSIRDENKKFPDPLAPAVLFDNVRDFYVKDRRFYILKTDNSLWVFGENYNYELGQKLESKDEDGFTIELDYYPPENAVLVRGDVANLTQDLGGIITTDKKYLEYNGNIAKGFFTETDCIGVVEFDENDDIYLRATGDVMYQYGGIIAQDVKELHRFEYKSYAITNEDKLIDLNKSNAVLAEDVAKVFVYDNVDQIVSIIKKDGTLWSMGENGYAQLGDGSKTDREEFVKIADDVMFAGVYCYVKTDGTLFTWDSSSPAHVEYTDVKFKAAFKRAEGYYPLLFGVDGSLRVPREDEGVKTMETADGIVYKNFLIPTEAAYSNQ